MDADVSKKPKENKVNSNTASNNPIASKTSPIKLQQGMVPEFAALYDEPPKRSLRASRNTPKSYKETDEDEKPKAKPGRDEKDFIPSNSTTGNTKTSKKRKATTPMQNKQKVARQDI